MNKIDISYKWLFPDVICHEETDAYTRELIIQEIKQNLRYLKYDVDYEGGSKKLTKKERDENLMEDFKKLSRWQYILYVYDKSIESLQKTYEEKK